MKALESAKDFVTKMKAGAFNGTLSIELSTLSHEELAEVERILIDRMKSRLRVHPTRDQRSPS
jgi:hypothetical protein